MCEMIFKPDIERLKESNDIEGLIKALKHSDKYICLKAVRALREVGDEKAIEPLREILSDREAYTAEIAGYAIEQIVERVGVAIKDREKAIKSLSDKLRDPSKYVRSGAVRALEHIGTAKTVEPLIKALKDRNKHVRNEAIRALGKIDDERVVEPLIERLKDRTGYVRHSAVNTLTEMVFSGRIDSKTVVEPFIELLKDNNEVVRMVTAKALDKISDKRSVEPLIMALKDESAYVRCCAAEALGKIGNPKSIDSLIWALKDKQGGGWHGKVCSVASDALRSSWRRRR